MSDDPVITAHQVADEIGERWAAVPGAAGYEVSSLGRVRSVDRIVHFSNGGYRPVAGRVLQQSINAGGYAHLLLGRSRNRVVHQLVLEAFVGPRPEGMQACHNDGDPTNNRLDNLRWDSPSANVRDTVRHGTHDRLRRTHCPRNHPLVKPNLVPSQWRTGGRSCLACGRALSRRRRLSKIGVNVDLKSLADAYYAELMEARSA